MIISHKHKFILFSPWKTASSTSHDRLISYNESEYDRFFYFNQHLNRVVHQHITISEFKSLPESQLDYFKASFVRNPYDRAYSGFIQLQRDIASQPLAPYPHEWVKELVKSQLAENSERLIKAEYDFNKWIKIIPDFEIYDVGRNTNMPLHPATYWTHHNGEQYVDFIGKVETFEDDFKLFCTTVGLENVSNSNQNVTDSRLLGQSSYRYVSKMSNESIDRINQIFSIDFELLKYEKVLS